MSIEGKTRGPSPAQRQRVILGLCLRCGKPRGEDGTRTLCRNHANKTIASAKRARIRNRAANLCDRCRKPRGNGNGRSRFVCIACSPVRTAQSKSMGRRWHEYGITDAEYEQLRVAQGGGCAICGKPQKSRPLAVDHNPKTGHVRGLLCVHCNTSIGKFNDDPDVLRKVINYLEKDSTIGLHRSKRTTKKRRSIRATRKDLQDIVQIDTLNTTEDIDSSPMVKLVYATCRHCGHRFIPRVEQPRQCGKCWKFAPLKSVETNRKKNTVIAEKRDEGK